MFSNKRRAVQGTTQAVEVRTFEPTATVKGMSDWKFQAVVRRPGCIKYNSWRGCDEEYAGTVWAKKTFLSKARAERWAEKYLRELVALLEHENYQKNITVR